MGALTNKAFAFKARPWEFKRIYTHDFNCPMATRIIVDVRGDQIIRILPQIATDNEQWITDRTRFFHDGLTKQRLTKALYRKAVNEPFTHIEQASAIRLLLEQPFPIHTVIGRSIDNERLIRLKHLAYTLGNASFSLDEKCSIPDLIYQPDLKYIDYLMSKNTVFLLLDTDLQNNYPTLESKLRSAISQNFCSVYSIGNKSYNFAQNLGNVFNEILYGKHNLISLLLKFDNICLIATDIASKTINLYLNMLAKIFVVTSIFTFSLPKTLSATNATYHNYTYFDPFRIKSNDIVLLYEADAIERTTNVNFITYIGHHGDVGAKNANLIIPNATLFEQRDTYTYTFAGKLIKYTQVHSALIDQAHITKIPQYISLFPETYFALNEELPEFIPNINEQQPHSLLQRDAVTRASPALAIASERFFTNAIARSNF
jgi:NADH dehydrogenase (ubiquinone) Fe-S protein 1